MSIKYESAKRGDTIVEVMFAIAIFSLVAIISIALMNMGVRQAEGSLEAVTARNELNAQAEALRFIHSSYISEMTLPECSSSSFSGDNSNKCQQYTETWNDIVANAVISDVAEQTGLLSLGRQAMDGGCEQFYEIGDNGQTPLSKVNAFVINTRDINADRHIVNGAAGLQHQISSSYVKNNAENKNHKPIFQQALLSPRILYTYTGSTRTTDDNVSDSTTDDVGSDNRVTYDEILNVEGLWVFAVKSSDDNPQYYDFYIETCWNPPNASTPSTLDTVIRLYNPSEVHND